MSADSLSHCLDPVLHAECQDHHHGTLGPISWFKVSWQHSGAATGFADWTFASGRTVPVMVKLPVGSIEHRWTCELGQIDEQALSTLLGNTDIVDVIMERYYSDADFIVAGTSAGAMAAASLMIYEGQRNEAMLKDTVKVSSGLGFIDHCIRDTHFVKRGRFGRLIEALLMYPSCIGIGLGEDTALVIRKGNEAECKGSGMVVILDGRDISETNIAYAEPGTPLWAENLRVHMITKGNYFLLHERKFVTSKKFLKKEKIGSKKIDKVKPDKIIIEKEQKIKKKKSKKASTKRDTK